MGQTPEIETHDSTRPVSTTAQARQAVPQGVIYVLVISLALIVVAYTLIYFW